MAESKIGQEATQVTEATPVAQVLAIKDVATAKAIEDSKEIKKQRSLMLKKCKNAKVVKVTIPEAYATFIGTPNTYMLNGIPITIYCDGKPHDYPDFVAKHINKKIERIMKSNVHVSKNTKLY